MPTAVSLKAEDSVSDGQATKMAVNVVFEEAIQSLDSLNSQIKSLLFPSQPGDLDPSRGQDGEVVQKSLELMRQLLDDAQTKFRKMVEDNSSLASRIDNSLHAANAEVSALRVELEDTNRRLAEIGDLPPPSDTKLANEYDEDPNNQALATELRAVRSENSSLSNTVRSLRRELEALRTASKFANATDESKVNELKIDLIQTRQELGRARDALAALKADRKRLKAEKLDLLSQMKQLYCTLEDKESELRDFIRQYEQRMTDSSISMKQLAMEKEVSEREKWEILKKAREATERAVALRAELDHKESLITQLETDLGEVRDKLSTITSSGGPSPPPPRNNLPPPLRIRNIRVPTVDDLPPPYRETPPPDPPSSARSCKSADTGYSTYTSSVSGAPSGSIENMTPLMESSRSSDEMTEGTYVTITPVSASKLEAKKKRKSMGSWSKMFGSKSRARRSMAMSEPGTSDAEGAGGRLSMLNQENYSEKLGLLTQAHGTPIDQWRASQVLAWLEIEMNMPLYARACAENIKSGKVLVGLSDVELDSALNIQRPLHRRKLQLAIEHRKHPDLYPTSVGQIDHTWVAHRWLPDLGLPQYTPIFERHLVCGRLLTVLARKDLEKHLGITRKFHQVSLLHGIELLRRLGWDKEVLNQRRSLCEEEDSDPLVWTNQRIIKWVQTIDLHEYADNLKESGVHGAVIVLEPTFTAEAMATALGIPPSKSYVRRHLASELEILVRPARAALEAGNKKRTTGGSLGRAFVRSYRGGSHSPQISEPESTRGSAGRKLTFRGSLGRALGRRVKSDLVTDTNTTRSSQGQLDPSKRSLSADLQNATAV